MVALLILIGATVFSNAIADEFPLRKDFPDLQTLSTEQLAERYAAGTAIVIDVRSEFEFKTIHAKDAINVPLAKKSFVTDLETHRAKDGDTPVVFYCNGTTCAKSYRAAKQAQDAGFANCFVYDAGIFAWTKAHPELASLMGQTPADPSKLISRQALSDKTIALDAFKSQAETADAVVVDIRDPLQRKVRLDFKRERNIPLDRFENLLKRGDMKDKDLLIYDAVGKQVRWLMYHLQESGYTRYAFLDGGVRKAIGDKKHY
jgi:rhodanese-related sulfurtransferase